MKRRQSCSTELADTMTVWLVLFLRLQARTSWERETLSLSAIWENDNYNDLPASQPPSCLSGVGYEVWRCLSLSRTRKLQKDILGNLGLKLYELWKFIQPRRVDQTQSDFTLYNDKLYVLFIITLPPLDVSPWQLPHWELDHHLDLTYQCHRLCCIFHSLNKLKWLVRLIESHLYQNTFRASFVKRAAWSSALEEQSPRLMGDQVTRPMPILL